MGERDGEQEGEEGGREEEWVGGRETGIPCCSRCACTRSLSVVLTQHQGALGAETPLRT